VRFDYGFLRREFQRLGQAFRGRLLCSVKLSRRLHPDEHGHSLDAVMARHGLGCIARHRALGDARVVAEFLRLVRRRADPARLAGIVEELTRQATLPPAVDPDLVDELPEAPGVYRFWGDNEALLYVGRSRNLRSRVLAHFAGAATSPRELRLCTQLRRLDWTETTGEFGAMLLELHEIRQRQPLFNQRSRPAPASAALLLTEGGDGLRPEIVALEDVYAVEDAYGVFRSPRDARKALEQIARAHDLCARVLGLETGDGSCFGHPLGRCRGVCVGGEPRALHDARVRLAFAAHKLRRWPFAGRIAVRERAWDGRTEWHVFGDWRFLGTASATEELPRLVAAGDHAFDLDTYRLLCRMLERPPRGLRIQELDRA
jgi:DNA polymerase-3 subunit epsilon